MDKAKLFARRLDEEDVEIPGVGTVRVRALTRDEALKVNGVELEQAELERRLLAWALVDPVLTEDEVAKWQAASNAGEIEHVTRVITRLSGMEAKADKAAYKSVRGKRRS